MLPSWEKRPVTVAHLLNPPFCGELIRRCSVSYRGTNDRKHHLPFPLAFIAIPLILNQDIRGKLPKKRSQSLSGWIEKNHFIKLELPDLIRSLVPYTREAIMFLISHNVGIINDSGEIEIQTGIKRIKGTHDDTETAKCFKSADLVGRWFSVSGSYQNIFLSLSIKP